jgi:hypothetical protein
MPAPHIKRYALVPQSGEDGVRRFSLARVTGGPRSAPERLERMEEIAERERRENGGDPSRGAREG